MVHEKHHAYLESLHLQCIFKAASFRICLDRIVTQAKDPKVHALDLLMSVHECVHAMRKVAVAQERILRFATEVISSGEVSGCPPRSLMQSVNSPPAPSACSSSTPPTSGATKPPGQVKIDVPALQAFQLGEWRKRGVNSADAGGSSPLDFTEAPDPSDEDDDGPETSPK